MQKRTVVKVIISYILGLALAIVFALFLNASVGWFMLIALILALILSVFFAWLTGRALQVECSVDGKMMSKGDTCTMTVTVHNKSIFPTTPVELVILNGDGVKSSDNSIIVNVLPMTHKKFTIQFKAKICGPSDIGIKDVKITDYLGLLSLKSKKTDYESLKKRVTVIPETSDITFNDDRILKIIHASFQGDDSEETVEAAADSFGGFPGYDNREYIPGDPLKRINWKQSAKRGKLLVRLDDETVARSVNVVLDSAFVKQGVNIEEMKLLSQYGKLADDEILPKIAEDAIENALGIMRALVLNNYTVVFYMSTLGGFTKYEADDEKDIETLRLLLAGYSFSEDYNTVRIPKDIGGDNSTFVYSTPNSYSEALRNIEGDLNSQNISVFSAIEEARENNNAESSYFINEVKIKKEKPSVTGRIKNTLSSFAMPFLLAMSLSVTVFGAFDISPLSYWTILQCVVCILIFALCSYTKKHKLIGGLIIGVVIVLVLSAFIGISSSGTSYLQWFMSGGDVVENTPVYLLSLILIFTVLFSIVIYYYTHINYRTSVMLLTSMLPFVLYVKLIRDIETPYVIVVIVLNVAAFLLNNRRRKDADKRIVGFKSGFFSVAMYGAVFILTALAVPKETTTRYYHLFEDAFLGGNTSVELPSEYLVNSYYSGNADNFNRLNNRKLYVMSGITTDNPVYLKRQVFDFYDFEYDRWYCSTQYSANSKELEKWNEAQENLDINELAEAMLKAEELSPGFLEKYGLEGIKGYSFKNTKMTATIEAQNFESTTLLVPTKTLNLRVDESAYLYATPHGAVGADSMFISNDVSYEVDFYDETEIKKEWIEAGGADCDTLTAYEMLNRLYVILYLNEESDYLEVVSKYCYDAKFALEYGEACENNNDAIPIRIKELALEITKDCTYDWEKAQALEDYFTKEDFIYDLSYDAPDDSAEYFLFEGKTGTCSDFASAYVLLARAAGLTVRYVEGFVPDEEIGREYSVEYVVRTKCSHAYPEVYIQNIGFVVYEPTVAAIYPEDEIGDGGVAGFVLTLGFRLIIIFAGVALLIVIILFVSRILAPYVKESIFISKVRKTTPEKAVIMLYEKILDKYSGKHILNANTHTPYEYAKRYEEVMELDISPLVLLVEKVAYQNAELYEEDKKLALGIYTKAKETARRKKHRRN